MPLVAFSLIAMFAAIAYSVDMARHLIASNQLYYAARSAALYGMQFAYGPLYDGMLALPAAESNMLQQITSSPVGLLNQAPGISSQGNQNQVPVTFTPSQVSFVANPEDASEVFLQVTAARGGDDALASFFLSLVFSIPGAGYIESFKMSPSRTCEVAGQPAARVGPGPAPGNMANGAIDYARFATLPLAISARQFPSIAYPVPPGTNTAFTVDLVSSAYAGLPGNIKGCLVNLADTGGGAGYSADSLSDQGINELSGLLAYFGAQSGQAPVAPACVERGSLLNAFDPAGPAFAARSAELAGTLTSLVNQANGQPYYIVPVLAGDPDFAAANQVIGFAYLALTAVHVNAGNNAISISVVLGPAIALPNTSASNQPNVTNISAPGQTSTSLPQAFAARQYDSAGLGLTPRYLGVVLSPAPSPRPSRLLPT